MIKKIYSIESGNFKLDGGAMFGVVPKSIWERTNPADDKNLIEMSARLLLIESANKLILIDTGLGDKQTEKFFNYYYLSGDHNIDISLKKQGFTKKDITDVFLTHLHFDHCGGAIEESDAGSLIPTFENATYWISKDHLYWAKNANDREKASFLKENIEPIEKSGKLNLIESPKNNRFFNSTLNFEIIFVDGHTDKQMLPLIKYKNKKILFVADLIPTVGHLPIPYLMGYDIRPLVSLNEKKTILRECYDKDYLLFFEHDPYNELVSLKNTDKGIRLDKSFKIKDYF